MKGTFTMKDVTIRPLTHADMDNIGELFQTREELDQHGAEKRKRLFEWLAFRNPLADGQPTYFIAEHDGKIVAHLGRMPTEFIIKGKRRKSYFVHDLYVHPEYRKKGLGFFLCMSLYKATENNSESFCCLVWTTQLNLGLQRLRGYHEQWADRYVKLFDPTEKLSKFIKQKSLAKACALILKALLLLTDSILVRLIPHKVGVSKIDRFDLSFDSLIQNISHKLGICSVRDSSCLNWKFIDRPFSNMTVFAARKNGRALGFVVVTLSPIKEYREGVIVDIMADPEDANTLSSLCKVAIDYCRERKVSSIECCLTDKRFVKIFKRFLFLKAFGKKPVMLANLDKCEEKEYLIDINNWHLNYGDSDRSMWWVYPDFSKAQEL
jgi:GNAT superfamily N-acetyltransferase